MEKMGERFEPALDKIKDLAINASAGLIGEMILSSVGPSMKDQVTAVIDEVRAALTAKPSRPDGAAEEASLSSPQRQDVSPHNRVRAARGNGRHV